MKRFAKQKLVIVITFGIVFTLFPIVNNNLIFTLGNNTNKSVYDDNIFIDTENLKLAKLSAPIHIDGNLGWANATGSGISSDPYIIEDLVIDGGFSSSPILIENSNVFFKIINCTLYNSDWEYPHVAGILLYNVTNAILINNDCFNNVRGIFLHHSDNNTIKENVANNNLAHGISVVKSDNNTFSRNILRFNSDNGLYITANSDDNIITGNTLNDNSYSGLSIHYYCNSNVISENIANNNRNGISLSQNCDNNVVLKNDASFNTRYGISLSSSDFNLISWNLLVGNGKCIKETECQGNIIRNNECVNLIPLDLFIVILIISGFVAVSLATLLLIRLKKKSQIIDSNKKTLKEKNHGD